MKYGLLIIVIIVSSITGVEAKANPVPVALKALSKKLASLKSISFQYYREINVPKNDYFDKFTGTSYIDFNQSDKQTVSRFRMECDNYILVYNGTDEFLLDKKAKTYNITVQPKQRSFSTHTFFFNSIQTLRSVIQQWVQSDSLPMYERDTIIQNKPYKLVRVDMHQYPLEYVNNFEKMNPLSGGVTVYYIIIIDVETGLPYQIVQTNSTNNNNFKTVFTNINTQPAEPAEDSWYCSTYQKEYQLKTKEKQTPLIAVGAMMMPVWSLPEYNGKDDPILNSSDLKGRLVLLDFWVKGCGPCMESFPVQQRLQKTYGGDSFQLLSINAHEKKADIGFFYKREQPLYKMLYDGEALAKALGIDGYPTLILFDKAGKVLYAGHNYTKAEALIKANL